MKQTIAVLMALILTLGPAQVYAGDDDPAEAEPQVIVIKEKKNHAGLGLAMGLVTGILLGGWAAAHIADESPGAFMAWWSLFSAGGALAGYATGGGFSKDSYEQALNEAREQLDQTPVATRAYGSSRGAEAVRSLRLSPIPGLDTEALELEARRLLEARMVATLVDPFSASR